MAGIDGFGTQFKRGDGATPEVFTALANATNIDGPALSRDTIEVTTHGSPDQYKEYLGGLKDGGEVKIDVNYDPSAHDSIVADFDDKLPRNYKIVFPDARETTWSFTAVMTGFSVSAPHDDKLGASLTFQMSGKPTIS